MKTSHKEWLPRTGGSFASIGLLCGRSQVQARPDNTQGLKITEEKVLPLKLHLQMVKTFKSSRIWIINRRACLTALIPNVYAHLELTN